MFKGKDKDKAKLFKGKDKDKDKGKLKKDKDKSWKKTGKNLTRSARAGLMFPVGRIHRMTRAYVTGQKRVSGSVGIYASAVMEYLCAEVLELAGNVAKETNQKRLTPRHLQLAIRGDNELNQLIKATIAGGGVVPHIEKVLLGKKSKTAPPSTPATPGGEY